MRRFLFLFVLLGSLSVVGCNSATPAEDLGEVIEKEEDLPGQDYKYPIPGEADAQVGPAAESES